MNLEVDITGYMKNMGKDYDAVTRTFAPKCGVKEDPVCGRAHCHIIPILKEKTQKEDFKCFQASKRGGELFCTSKKERVKISGNAVVFAVSNICI